MPLLISYAHFSIKVVTMPIERELKFSLLEDFPSFEELAEVFRTSGYTLSVQDALQQHDRYYDDEVETLKQRGLALRRRSVNGEVMATLKRQGEVAGALHERLELELPMTSGTWPGPVIRPVSTLTDPTKLRIQLELITERLNYAVVQDGVALARVSFDDVSASYPQSEQSVHFTEAEIEALGDTPSETLQGVADVIDRVVRLTPNPVNKVARAEALLSLGASFNE